MKVQIVEIKTGSIGLKKKISVIQEDTARQLKCILSDFTIPDDSTARIYAVKPSGNKIYDDGVIEGTNTVLIDVTTQLIAEIGEVACQVEITESNGNVLTSFEFYIEVKKRLKDASAIESTNEFSALEDALGKVQNIDAKIAGMITATKAKLIKEATTTYGGGFRLYTMGSFLIVENIPGLLVTGTVTQTLFTYDEEYPKVSNDQTYYIGDGINLTLTTNRELKFQATTSPGSSLTFTVAPGIEIFMSDSLYEGGEIIVSTNLILDNITVNPEDFAEDTTYEDYPYKVDLACTGITANYVPTVNFAMTQAISGNYSPIAVSGLDKVTIYSTVKETEAFTIPSIVCVKGGV